MKGLLMAGHFNLDIKCDICKKVGVTKSFKDCKHCNVDNDSTWMCTNLYGHKKIKMQQNQNKEG